MSIEGAIPSPTGRVIVVGNEKGGSGKSTVAMHVAIALMKSNERVATIDLNSRQRTFTNYIENRYDRPSTLRATSRIPHHLYFVENTNYPTAEDEAADGKALTDHVVALARNYNFIVMDSPGRNSSLGRLAHSIADILITPLNDSFVDLDVLGTVDRPTIEVMARAITVRWCKTRDYNATVEMMSALIGLYYEIAFPRLNHTIHVAWAKGCESCHEGSIFTVLQA